MLNVVVICCSRRKMKVFSLKALRRFSSSKSSNNSSFSSNSSKEKAPTTSINALVSSYLIILLNLNSSFNTKISTNRAIHSVLTIPFSFVLAEGTRRDEPSSSDTEERTYNRHQRKVNYRLLFLKASSFLKLNVCKYHSFKDFTSHSFV
jgi:hypothetical protein